MEDYIKVKREVGNRKDEMWYAFLQDLKAGLCLTLGYLFKKKITMQYPYEKSTAEWSIPLRWRGLHALSADENGRLKCIMCLQCMKICPDHCIKIRFSGAGKERVLEEFTVDLSRCSACGLCFEACPVNSITKAIVPTEKYELSVYSREGLVYKKEDLLKNWYDSVKSRIALEKAENMKKEEVKKEEKSVES
ncbi:MAG: hypothetical protein A2149_04680 [Candidatus Schekmanbacteria bacterium RBG_16_38_11]|uniref:NADH-quinone oxidoreductase subunit I n=2 Tax=Candidatus Schekmaniibacteriota TaxID=1817811 RepID=A0A1F7RCJ4_9BACT|nr:MAG: hypothetical protein A2042_07305 [Candidatus Schekmanbacteria bacterium GWA2_38_11]OGL45500.1 MAG: hypothetical protein A2149_04680 [Candidatus Schekmanbacteria bacterium RBG_16_38_11]